MEPFVIGTGRPVRELIEVVRVAGSAWEAANAIGLSTTPAQAALDYYEEHGAGTVPAASSTAPAEVTTGDEKPKWSLS